MKTFRLVRMIIYAILGCLIFVIPVSTTRIVDICPMHLVTDLDCLFCGMTRSLIALCRFRFEIAFNLNPLSFVVIPTLVFLVIQDIYMTIIKSSNDSIIEVLFRGEIW